MNDLRILFTRGAVVATIVALAGCTDGAPGSRSGNAAGVTTIEISLTQFAPAAIPAGRSGGYSPAQMVVPVGTQIRFTNIDSFAHTASSVGSGAAFPASSPLTATALVPSTNDA